MVLIHSRAAIRAAAAVPQHEFHKRAFRVVGPQDTGDERKKIQQPALLQGLTDRMSTVALTQNLVHDVRMCDVFPALGRMRILGDYSVRGNVAACRPRPIQANLKRT